MGLTKDQAEVVVVGRWCWLTFSAGSHTKSDIRRARAYYACGRCGSEFFVLSDIISVFLAWAWLAKAKGHSCHTKIQLLPKPFTEKNE